tara:strand:- start:229 stop:636 length:408 start_codon:yes stop_codon:yes gene_type:complete
MTKDFTHEIKVYYEDTDSGGVVYYSNYLNFLERARTEMINLLGLSNNKLLKDHKTLIIVKSCNIEYIKPAKLEDRLKIYSSIESFNKASFIMKQNVYNNDDLISKAILKLVTVNIEGKPVKIPSVLENQFKSLLS